MIMLTRCEEKLKRNWVTYERRSFGKVKLLKRISYPQTKNIKTSTRLSAVWYFPDRKPFILFSFIIIAYHAFSLVKWYHYFWSNGKLLSTFFFSFLLLTLDVRKKRRNKKKRKKGKNSPGTFPFSSVKKKTIRTWTRSLIFPLQKKNPKTKIENQNFFSKKSREVQILSDYRGKKSFKN